MFLIGIYRKTILSRVLLIVFSFHIIQAKLLVVLVTALISFHRKLIIWLIIVREGLDIGITCRIFQHKCDYMLQFDDFVEGAKEAVQLILGWLIGRVVEQGAIQLLTHGHQQALDGGKAAAEGIGTHIQIQFWYRQTARFRFKDIARQILFGGNAHLESHALWLNAAARLHLVRLVAAFRADGGHDDHLLEVRYVSQLHVCLALRLTAGTVRGELQHFAVQVLNGPLILGNGF